MATMLITEALQQVKILTDRIQKKQALVVKYATQNSRFTDPLKKDGGSEKILANELQSIADLSDNLVKIRTTIQKKNLDLVLTIEGISRSVAEWLIWRREVSSLTNEFLVRLSASISQARALFEKEQKSANPATAEGQTVKESQLVVNVPELQLAKNAETHALVLGTLDAKLSILNATTSIEV